MRKCFIQESYLKVELLQDFLSAPKWEKSVASLILQIAPLRRISRVFTSKGSWLQIFKGTLAPVWGNNSVFFFFCEKNEIRVHQIRNGCPRIIPAYAYGQVNRGDRPLEVGGRQNKVLLNTLKHTHLANTYLDLCWISFQKKQTWYSFSWGSYF